MRVDRYDLENAKENFWTWAQKLAGLRNANGTYPEIIGPPPIRSEGDYRRWLKLGPAEYARWLRTRRRKDKGRKSKYSR